MTAMGDLARSEAEKAIHHLVTAAGGQLTRRPAVEGEPVFGTVPAPEPLAGLTAARHLEHAARYLTGTYAKAAREQGRSWPDIGTALGYKPGPGDLTPAESAFRAVAYDLGHEFRFYWGCACGETIADNGLELANPRDAEEGHAPGCPRLAADVAAYTARWGEDS